MREVINRLFGKIGYMLKNRKELIELIELGYDIKEIMDDILIKAYFKNWIIDDLFLEAENKLHLIYIFLAILELYKDAKINIDDGEIRKC